MAKKTSKKRTTRAQPPSDDVGIVGSRAREARAKAKMRYIDLATASDLPMSMISRMENGSSDIRAVNLKRVAMALDVSADWLLGLSNTRERRP